MSTIQVDAVTTLADFVGLEAEWNRLAGRVQAHPFLSFSWFRAWWESFGRNRQLHVVIARSDGAPALIAPLMIEDGQFCGRRARWLTSMANDHTPRFEFLKDPAIGGLEPAVWRALSRQSGGWDGIRVKQVPTESSTVAGFVERARAGGWLVGEWEADQSPVVRVAGQWSSYLQTLSKRHRAAVRRKLAELQRTGTVEIEVIDGAGAVADALTEGMEIEADAWKRRAGTAMTSHASVEHFYRLLAQRVGPSSLNLVFLTVGGTRIAFAYTLRDLRAMYVLKTGYLAAYSRYTPTHLLFYLWFRDEWERGLSEFEFLGADEPWKRAWAHHVKPHRWLFVLPDNHWMRWAHRVKFDWAPRLKAWPLVSLLGTSMNRSSRNRVHL